MNREELQNVLKSLMLTAAVSGVAFVGVGCEESATEDATEDVTEGVEDAQAGLLDKAEGMADSAGDKMAEMKDKAGDMADDLGIDMENLDSVDWANLKDGQAASMIEKLETLIGEGKIDQAKAMLAKLDGMSDKLPESVTSKLDGVRSLLDKAEGVGELGDKASDMLGGGK